MLVRDDRRQREFDDVEFGQLSNRAIAVKNSQSAACAQSVSGQRAKLQNSAPNPLKVLGRRQKCDGQLQKLYLIAANGPYIHC